MSDCFELEHQIEKLMEESAEHLATAHVARLRSESVRLLSSGMGGTQAQKLRDAANEYEHDADRSHAISMRATLACRELMPLLREAIVGGDKKTPDSKEPRVENS